MSQAMVALKAASLAMDALQAFSSNGGTLGAMLSAQWQLSNLIVERLNAIHRAIGDVIIRIDDLRESFVENLDAAQLRNDLKETAAVAQIYGELIQTASLSPGYLEKEPGSQRLALLLNDIQLRRAALSNSNQGLSPEAAMVIPVIMGAELSALVRRGETAAALRPPVNAYAEWLNALTDVSDGSLETYQLSHIARHDALVDRWSNTRLGRSTKLWDFRAISTEGHDQVPSSGGCFLFVEQDPVHVQPDVLTNACWWLDSPMGSAPSPTAGGCIFRTPSLSANEDDAGGQIQIKLTLSEWKGAFRRPAVVEGDRPPETYEGYAINVASLPPDVGSALAIVKTDGRLARFEADHSEFEALVAQLNYHRACVALAHRARAIAFRTEKELDNFQKMIGI